MIMSELQESVQRELFKTLYRDLYYGIVAAWISGSVLLYGLWPVTEHAALSVWFLALSLDLMLSLIVLRRYNQKGWHHPPEYWLSVIHRMMLLFTAIWMVGIFLFFPDHAPLYQSFFIITLAGVTAGAPAPSRPTDSPL